MSRSIFAAFLVVCGAALGCMGYGLAFGAISSTMFEYSAHRGLIFGLTFGSAGGAFIAMMTLGADKTAGPAVKALPHLLGLGIVAAAFLMLFEGGGWDMVFGGSRGMALASIAMWAGVTGWLAYEIAA